MNFQTFAIMLVCTAQVVGSLGGPRSVSSRFDCSMFINDRQVLKKFQYSIPVNPENPTDTETYAKMDKNGNIYFMNIVNQNIVPGAISCLKHLKQLKVGSTCSYRSKGRPSTKIERLPLSLIHLKVYDTAITYWPDNFGELIRLEILDLRNTSLIKLPDNIGNLVSLTHIFLSYNSLKTLPATIKNLRSLKQITLSNNPLLRSIQAVNELPSLDFLETDNCPIEQLPLNLPQLIDLHMSNNNLTNLTGIYTLGQGSSDKKSFYFDGNYISSIPCEIRYVKNLFLLNLNDNKLRCLHFNIFMIDTLDTLYIKNNLFTNDELKAFKTIFNATNRNLKLFV